ncbi:MAG: CarD family transcriptional regulator [Oscillospiraceae bacterium]|jgi:CarD family transcriptional regulator|nr:CarD family transcriptional regulator [Oscillospiraceae bacterium]
MIAIGDEFIYSGVGVCKVTEITQMSFGSDTSNYYVLKPVFEASSTIYIKTDSSDLETKIRRLLTKEEIMEVIRRMPAADGKWEADESKRREQFKETLRGSDRDALGRMIKSLYLHGEETRAASKSKKVPVAEENYLKDAEKVLYEEFAYVLGIQPREVLPFIAKQLSETAE